MKVGTRDLPRSRRRPGLGASPGAKAIATDGGYIVNYSGAFASGSRHATWLGAHCLVHEADGSPRLGADKRPELRAMLFPKSQAEIKDVWHVVSLRGTGSDLVRRQGPVRSGPAQLPLRDDAATRPMPARTTATPARWSTRFAPRGAGHRPRRDGRVRGPRHAQDPARLSQHAARERAIQADVAQAEAKWTAARHYLRAVIGDAWREIDQGSSPPSRSAWPSGRLDPCDPRRQDGGRQPVRCGRGKCHHGGRTVERRSWDIHAVTQQLQGRKAHFLRRSARPARPSAQSRPRADLAARHPETTRRETTNPLSGPQHRCIYT